MAIRSSGHILHRSAVRRFVGVNPVVLRNIGEVIQAYTSIKVGVLPWRGTTGYILVDHPTDKYVLRQKMDRIQKAFDEIIGSGRITKIIVRVGTGQTATL